MVMNGRGGLLMLLEPFCKSSCRLSNVFFFTPIFTTFVSVYDPTLVGDRISTCSSPTYYQLLLNFTFFLCCIVKYLYNIITISAHMSHTYSCAYMCGCTNQSWSCDHPKLMLPQFLSGLVNLETTTLSPTHGQNFL